MTTERDKYLNSLNQTDESYKLVDTRRLTCVNNPVIHRTEYTYKFTFPGEHRAFIQNLRSSNDKLIKEISFEFNGMYLYKTQNLQLAKRIFNTEYIPIPLMIDKPIPLINFEVYVITSDEESDDLLDLYCDYFRTEGFTERQQEAIFTYHNLSHGEPLIRRVPYVHEESYLLSCENNSIIKYHNGCRFFVYCPGMLSCVPESYSEVFKLADDLYEVITIDDWRQDIHIKKKSDEEVEAYVITVEDNCVMFCERGCCYRYVH